MADSITIDLMVRDRGTSVLQKIGESMQRLFKQFQPASKAFQQLDRDAQGRFLPRVPTLYDRITGALKQMVGGLGHAGKQSQVFGQSMSASVLPLKTIAASIAAIGFGRLVSDTVQVAQRMEGLQLAMAAAAGSSKEGAVQFQFVRDEAKRLGIEVMGAAEGYKGLLAATLEAGHGAKDAQTIFAGFNTLAKASGLSTEALEASFRALGQIMGKDQVMAEELKSQLGDHLPQAMGLLAKTMGVGTKELLKMMEAGDLTGKVVIPMAARAMAQYADVANQAAQGSQSAGNRMRNAMTELKTAIGKGGLLDAVTIVSTALTGLFENMRNSGAAEQIGESFKSLATQFATLAATHGPAAVKSFADIVTAINNGLIPAMQAITTTGKEVWSGLRTSLSTVDGWMQTSAKFWTDKVKGFVKVMSDDFKNAGGKGMDGLVSKLDGLGKQFEKAGDKAKEMAAKQWKALNDSKAATLGVGEATKFTAAEVRALGDGFVIVDGAAVRAGNAMKEAVEKPKGPAQETSVAISDLAKAYSELGEKSGQQLQEAALKSAGAFRTIADSGTETKERLATMFAPVAQKIIDAFGKVPPEMSGLFNEMKMRTGVDFREVQDQGASTAQSLTDSFTAAGSNMTTAIGDAADKMIEKLSATKKRSEMLTQQSKSSKGMLDAFASFYSENSRIEYGSTLPELQKQLKFFQREKADVWLNSNETSARGYQKFLTQEFDAIIKDIQGRISALKEGDAQGQGDESLVLGGSGGGAQTPPGTRTRRSSSGAGGGGSAGGGSVVIEGAQFTVNQNGIDPRAVDARGLVRAMLPSLREEIRRGSLALGPGSA